VSVAPAADPYRSFLDTRWASRARLLILYGLVASVLFVAFDLGVTRGAAEPPSLARILGWRSPSFLIPALGWFAQRYAGRSRLLPAFTVGLSALWTWGNAAAFMALGLGGTAFHALAMVVAFICTSVFLPVERRGRIVTGALLGVGQAAVDLLWPGAGPLAPRLWTQALLLAFGASTGLLFEDFARSRRRSYLLQDELRSTVAALEASRHRMAETAVAVASTAEQLGRSASGLVERVERSGREGQEVAGSLQRLAGSASLLRGRSRESATAAADAAHRASAVEGLIGQIEAGVREVERAVALSEESFGGLERRAQAIQQLVESTRDVALQTHMLAVNAGIQAVSAGEHGKGFAVIAEAIRTLSRDSGRSAGEITRVVDDVSQEMARVVGAIAVVRARASVLAAAFDEARATVERVRGAVGALGEAMAANAGDAEAQAAATAHVSEAAGRITALLDAQAQAAAEIARSSATLAGHASGLRALLPAEGAASGPSPHDT